MATNTSGMERLVLSTLADIYSSGPDDLFETAFRDMSAALGNQETLQIGASASMTVNEATSGTAATSTPSFMDLENNKVLSMFITIPQLSQAQYLGGGAQVSFNASGVPGNPYVQGTLRDALLQMLKRRSTLADLYLRQKAWTSAAATYYNNVEGDTLTEADVESSIAELELLDGEHDIAIYVNPFGHAALKVIPGYQPMPAGGAVGMQVGSINGYPVFRSNAIARGIPPGWTAVGTAPSGAVATAQVATVASSSSGTYTFTLPSASVDGATVNAGGFVLGERVYAPSIDNPISEANAGLTTTATATSVVTAYGAASDGDELTAGTYAGIVASAGIKNFVVDRAHLFRSTQMQPTFRIIPRGTGYTDDELQITMRFGMVARSGRVRVLVTPKSVL